MNVTFGNLVALPSIVYLAVFVEQAILSNQSKNSLFRLRKIQV